MNSKKNPKIFKSLINYCYDSASFLFGKINSFKFPVSPKCGTLTWFGKAASERRNLVFYKLSGLVRQQSGSLAYTINLYVGAVLHTRTRTNDSNKPIVRFSNRVLLLNVIIPFKKINK